MTIVIAIIMIVGGIALLLAQEVTRSVHLQQTASNYSNLLQQARVRAVQNDQYYAVVTKPAASGNPAYAFIDIQQTGTYASGDPEFFFNSDVKPVSRTNMVACSVTNLESQYLPAGVTIANIVNTASASPAEGPTFGPRGLPCWPSSTSGGTCPFLSTPTAYEIFMKNTHSLNYEAVTVTPAGRIRQWSCGSSGTWSPMN
jgi:Tfp pilus assembly protein FimT